MGALAGGLRVALNADIGEGCGDDAALLAHVDAASIACGGHAGDAASMRTALRQCRAAGVRAGAHPSHADRAHFGRRALDRPPAQVEAEVRAQLQALQALAAEEGLSLAHVKPHGALYNQAAVDEALAEAVVRAVRAVAPHLAVMGLAGSALPRVARRLGLAAIDEGFADRGYTPQGLLVPREQPGAFIEDPAQAAAQIRRLRAGAHPPQSFCIHGDRPGAAEFARRLRALL